MTNTETPEKKNQDTKKRTPAWLIASVILNVFLVGLMVGSAPRYWFHGGPHGGPGHHHDFKFSRGDADMGRGAGELRFLFHAMRGLPEETQNKFKSQLGAMRKDLRPLVRDMHTNMDRTLTIVTTDPIDAGALRQSFDRQNATRDKIETLTQSAVLDFIAGLSDEERAQLSAAIKSSWEQRRPWQDHKPGGPGGPPPDDYPGSPPPEEGPAPE